MARPRTSPEHKRLRNRTKQKAYATDHPLTPEQKARKRANDKARQQTPEYKAKSAAKYRARREAEAAHQRPDLCEICGNPPNGMGALHWDHCHTTGAFRGWLCHSCNFILGHVRDDPVLLRKMADYLDLFPRPEGEYQPKAKRQTRQAASCAIPTQDSLF